MSRSPALLVAALAAPALLACGSAAGSGGTGASSRGTGGRTSSAAGPATASTAGAGGARGAGGATTGVGTGGAAATAGTGGVAAACDAACVQGHTSAYQKLQGYELQSCGCAVGQPCAGPCAPACPSGKLPPVCQACLLTESTKEAASACTMAAGLSCFQDPACAPFMECRLGCGG